MLQALVLFLVNNVLLVKIGSTSSGFKLSLFREDTNKKTINVNVPSDAEMILSSYDATYVSYIREGRIEVVSTDKNQTAKIIGKDNVTLTGYLWLPDKNMIIYSYQVDAYLRVGLTSYDVDNDIEHDYKYITEVTYLPAGSRIIEIKPSFKTNVTYIKIAVNDRQAYIIRVDIHENRYKIMTVDIDTEIQDISLMDYLVLREPEAQYITVRQGQSGESHRVDFGRDICLLDNDSEYGIYIGGLDGNANVEALYKGSYEDRSPEAWQQVILETPVTPGDIYMSGKHVYLYLRDGNLVKDLNTGAKTGISGQLLNVAGGYALTRENGNVSLIPLK